MIVCDTSAIVAILRGEADAERYQSLMVAAPALAIPAAVYVEAAMVAATRNFTRRDLDVMIRTLSVAFIPLDEPVARLAADAFSRYGRGAGHAAALNFGDCISYATARWLDSPLLFKGDDFRHTDVQPAL